MATSPHLSLAIAAQALGIATGALEFATTYARDRQSFGKPI
ncbi:MAG: acyl-CoA dehydrogenase, partial [Candidatus Eremiobacteraeota bacterium]|nr:acyl-CoA dehydrogenase [Candidatus Eremiobacteraeota bacterium]